MSAEAFNDTPLVNGTAYPTLTVDPKSYRMRILNAANDRLFDLQDDPGERKNVIAEHPDVAARLKALLDAQKAKVLAGS